MSQFLDLALLRVYDQSNRVIGTSFLVDDIRAITCAHVIKDALGIREDVDLSAQLTVKVDFPLLPQQKTCFARVCFLDWDADIAGLELTSAPPLGAQPVRMIIPDTELWSHNFRTMGFSMREGVWASGVLRGKNAEGWIQIEDTQRAGYSIQPGFSGAPVWDEDLKAVVGMVVAADKNVNVKAAFCIPCELLLRWDLLKGRIKTSGQKARLFLSYKRDAQPDQKVVDFLLENLSDLGYTLFIDTETLRAGEDWLKRIDQELKESDFLVVLLSPASADSEMVQSEVHRAYEYRKLYGNPRVLPIRVGLDGMLPYSISAFLNPLQYIVWNDENDNERVTRELMQAIQGELLAKDPTIATPLVVSEDSVSRPVPEFDARILDELREPGGTVRLRDRFYIKRDEDRRMENEMKRLGSTVTIRAARQSGKSSLLVRGLDQAKQSGARTLLLDMQRVDKDHRTSIDVFLRYFAEFIVDKLMLDVDVIDRYWKRSLSPQEKLTNLFMDFVFENIDRNLVIGLDEIDDLLQTNFYSEFFGLLRSWHNLRATDEVWDKLSTIMVISTEPYLLISDFHQSPFNVGTNLNLQDFTDAQVRDLNERHGTPLSGRDLDELFQTFGGHPFLTRKAFYLLVVEKFSWKALQAKSAQEDGPFADHLRRYHWMIQQDPALRDALRSIIKNNRCSEELLHRLLQAGLVKASGDLVQCRCDLYRTYFEDKL